MSESAIHLEYPVRFNLSMTPAKNKAPFLGLRGRGVWERLDGSRNSTGSHDSKIRGIFNPNRTAFSTFLLSLPSIEEDSTLTLVTNL